MKVGPAALVAALSAAPLFAVAGCGRQESPIAPVSVSAAPLPDVSSSAVDQVVLIRESEREVVVQMFTNGFYCSLLVEKESCHKFFTGRVTKNPRIIDALAYAHSREVLVVGGSEFSIIDGVVRIDIKATDEAIVRFLCGDKGCPKK